VLHSIQLGDDFHFLEWSSNSQASLKRGVRCLLIIGLKLYGLLLF